MTPETVFTILLFAAVGALVGGALGSPDPIGWLADGLRGLWDAYVRMFRGARQLLSSVRGGGR